MRTQHVRVCSAHDCVQASLAHARPACAKATCQTKAHCASRICRIYGTCAAMRRTQCLRSSTCPNALRMASYSAHVMLALLNLPKRIAHGGLFRARNTYAFHVPHNEHKQGAAARPFAGIAQQRLFCGFMPPIYKLYHRAPHLRGGGFRHIQAGAGHNCHRGAHTPRTRSRCLCS